MSENISTYIQILLNSLELKISVLKNLTDITIRQESVLDSVEFDMDAFDSLMDEKQRSIDQLVQLDNGFENVYERVKRELPANRINYQTEIKKMQNLIKLLTELNVNLQAMEERNKAKFEACLKGQRQQIKQKRMSNQTAVNYYKNMADQHQGQSYFLDKKN
jgi:FlgN protein.